MSDFTFSSGEDIKRFIEENPEPAPDETLGGRAVAHSKKRLRQQIRTALRNYDNNDDLYLDLS